MRIGVVGTGPGGAASALLLARDGHEVQVFDLPPDQRRIGAGLMLQRLAQEVLDRLDLLEPLAATSAPITGVDGRTRSGRAVMDFAYADAVPGAYGLGVSRTRLMDLLATATAERVGASIEARAVGHERDRAGTWIRTEVGARHGPFDLVVGADGSNSALRRNAGLTSANTPYPWGAVWALMPDPDGLVTDTLVQRYDGTRVTLGLLPVGSRETVMFWSAPVTDLDALTADPTRWHALARPPARELAPLVDRAAEGRLLAARYWDVRTRSPIAPGLVLVGDAAHATSPQLGSGASLALADAWTLAAAVRSHPGDLRAAAHAYAAARRAHVAYYQFCSRIMTPVFQSDLTVLGPPRDLLMPLAARVPWVRRQFVTTLMGVRTSPWGWWDLPE